MPRPIHLLLVFVLAVAGVACAPVARGAESIWSGLLLATNEAHPAEPASQVAKFYPKLKNIFGYNQYELMGEHVELMDTPSEHWLIPGKEFSLLVNSTKAARPGVHYRLKLELYQEKKMLAGMEASLCGQNLLFIRGPFFGKGQFLIVLLVK
jgi:hypothetical protein